MNGPGGQDNRNVNVTLNADVANYQRQMDAANKSTVSLTGAITNLGKALDEIVRKTSKGLVLFGTGGMAGLVAAAYQANKLNDAFAQVRSTAALTNQSVGGLERGAESLASKIPMSTEAIAQLMSVVQDIGARGTPQIQKLTEVAARLAEATNTAPGELFTGLAQLTRTLGNSYNDLDRYSSALVDLSKRNGVAAQSILDFSNAFQAVGAAAGLSEQTILGISTAVAKTGTDAYSASTTLTRVTGDLSAALATNSAQLSTYANILGVTREQLKSMAAKDTGQVLVDLFDSLRAKGKDAIPYIQQLGLDGPRALRTIASLTSSQANLKGAVAEANSSFADNTALNKASDAGWKGFTSTMTKLRSEIAQLVATFGGPFLTVMNAVAKVADIVLHAFNALPGPIKELAALATSLGPIILAFAGIELAARRMFAILSPIAALSRLGPIFGGMRAGYTGSEPRQIAPGHPIYQGLQNTGVYLGQRAAQIVPPGRDGTPLYRRALMFPVNMFQAAVTETGEAVRHFGQPDLYDPRRINNPYTIHGFFGQRIQDMREIAAGERDAPGGRVIGGGVSAMSRLFFGDQQKAAADLAAQRAAQGAESPAWTRAYNLLRGGANVAGAAGSVTREAGGTFSALARGLMPLAGSLVNTIGIIGVLGAAGYGLYTAFHSLAGAAREAASKMDDLGSGLATATGKQYNRPSGTFGSGAQPAITPFSSQDIAKATLDTGFTKKIGKDVASLRLFNPVRGTSPQSMVAAAQQMVDNYIANANGGAALSSQQQDALRRTLINAYGADVAQTIVPQLNFAGTSTVQQAAAGGQLAAATPDFFGAGKVTRQRLRIAATPAINMLESGNATGGALAFAQYLQGAGGSPDKMKAALETFQDAYNKGKDKSEQVNFTDPFHAGQGNKSFLEGLKQAGLNLNDLNGSIKTLTKTTNDQEAAAKKTANSQLGVMGALAQKYGFDLTQTQDVNYGFNVYRANAKVGMDAQGKDRMGLLGVPAQRAQLSATLGMLAGADPNSQAYQFFSQQAQSQSQGLTQAMGMFGRPGTTANQTLGMINDQLAQGYGSNTNTQGFVAGEIGNVQSMVQQDIGALRSYLTQVRDFHIQETRMGEDHTIQLTRMERDRGVQIAEAQYQYQTSTKRRWHDFYESIRQMTYQYADAFNPFQRQQSQYTVGASLALDNTNRENQYMKQMQGNLAKLHKMGISNDVIRVLGLDDPQNFQQLQRFVEDLAQDPKLVQAWNASIKNRLDLSKAFATDPMNSKFAEMKRQFDYQGKIAAEDFNHAMKVASEAYNRSLKDFNDNYDLALKRMHEDEARLGETMFSSIDTLLKKAKDSGIKNLQEYADEIAKTLTGLALVIKNFSQGTPVGKPNVNKTTADNSVPHADGTILTSPTNVGGEAGPEALIPLNQHGMNFVRQAMGMRTAGYETKVVYSGTVNNIYDASTAIHGPITVTGVTNPRTLANQLQKQARITALRRPMAKAATV